MPRYRTSRTYEYGRTGRSSKANDLPGERQPVRIEGTKIAKNWWGKAWNDNLESYSDYSNRLPRGRTYVRKGAVVDLRIEKGLIEARVQGSSPNPYAVKVRIDELSEKRKDEIVSKCANKVQNIEALANGDIPRDVADAFTSRNGLFPSPSEIHFSCSCPDWADMCKHVAAVLYGVGSRLDETPMMFFTLRGMDIEPLIGRTVEQKIDMMLKNAKKKSDRIIGDDEMEELFGKIR